MAISTGLIIDILLILLLVVFAFMYAKKGFVSGIVEFFGSLVSLGLAFFTSNSISPKLFGSFFEKNMVEKITTAISTNQGVLTLEETIKKVLGFLPQNIVEAFLGENQLNIFDVPAPQIAQQLVNDVIKPLILPIISVIIFFVVFALAKLAITFIAAALTNINKIPLVGGVNRMLGLVSGVCVGALNVFIICAILSAVVVVTANELSVLNNDILIQSKIYSLLTGLIPFKI